jgi:UTP-glucose-1-phosphate uridylyltransferase
LEAQIAHNPNKQAQLDKELARRTLFAGLTIEVIEQPVGPYGTAVPLDLARRHLQTRGIECFIVTGGDDFIWYADGHSEWADALSVMGEGQDLLIMGDAVDPADAPRYGILQADEQGRLQQIIENPAPDDVPPNPVRNISRYIAGPELWPHLEAEMARVPEAGQPEHYVTDVINNAIAAGDATYRIHRIRGTYLDCGTPPSTLAASQYITSQL